MRDSCSKESKSHTPEFEEVYPRHEFSGLVRIGIIVAERFCRILRGPEIQRLKSMKPRPHRESPRGQR